MTATIAEVAKAAGVSPGTVSNVLNRPDVVQEATRTRVMDAMQELNYRPNRQARMLAGGRDNGIGLVLHDAGNPFFAQIAHSVDDVAEAHGYGIMLASSRASVRRQQGALGMFVEHQLSGILLSPTVEGPQGLKEIRNSGVPVVLVDYPGAAGECSVAGDDIKGGGLAADHLLELGHTKMAFVGGATRVRQHGDRLNGLKASLRRAKLPLRQHLRNYSVEEDTIDCGRRVAAAVYEHLNAIDGIVCGNDLIAIGLINELGALGVRVPKDVSVVGYDDIDLAQLVHPALTTIHQPMTAMGGAATKLLLEEVSGKKHRHQHLTFDPHLVVRKSTS